MNLLECYVTSIESKPYLLHGKWWVNVKADCYGSEQRHSLMFNTEQEAEKINVGYKFLA